MRLGLATVESNPAHLFIIGGGDARSLWVALSERAVSPTTPLPRAGTPNSQKSTSSRSFLPGPHLSIPTFQPSRTICNLIFAERTVAFLLPVECFLVLFSLFPFPEEGNPSQTLFTAPEKRGASINISKSIAAVARGHELPDLQFGTERKSCWTCSAARCRVLPMMGPASPFPVCVQIGKHREEERPFCKRLSRSWIHG